MKDQTSQKFHRECTKCDLWKIPHLENIDERSKLLKSFIENVLSVDLWKIPHLKISMKDQTSQDFFEMYQV